jgi:L-ascorbate metabolism protein UlaG (beta-lactamase superfamily)
MRITRLGHACIRIEDGHDRPVVIDPGAISDPEAVRGARAVLVTHEHMDHFQPEALRKALADDPALQVWTNASVAGQLPASQGRVHVVGEGDTFEVEGLEVQVHGQWHAPIHRDLPRVANVGFLLGGTVFHPGDAFTVPGGAVETLLLPMHGPWSKTGEVVDYVREVAPVRAYPIHDGALSDAGRGMVGNLLTNLGAPFRSLLSDEAADA